MSQTANPTRTVPTRRLALEPTFDAVPRHFAADGDLILSHLVAALSSVFPDGEDFFVRSVRHFRDQITDPALKRQVAGFIGQEAMHGREHRAFNAHLDTTGYHTKLAERITRKSIAFRERHLSAVSNLAATAALEHFTATIAELVLSSPEAQELFGHEAVRNLFLWHALEESEHKAVAFDVYKAVGGSERLRVFTMRLIRVAFLVGMSLTTTISLATDRDTYRPGQLRASWRRFRSAPFMTRDMWQRLRDYDRPDFHPDDRPTAGLIHDWSDRLFGYDGALRSELVGAGAGATSA